MIDEDGRRSRRSTRYSGDFQLAEFSDLEGSDQEEKPKQQLVKQRSSSQKYRTKECPGCGALLGLAIRECTHCDYTFTSKSMLPGVQSAIDESRTIRNRFPFEPEREEDGTLKIQFIFGRKLRKDHHKRLLTHKGSTGHPHSLSAVDSKFDYDYLVKYKTMSYLHVQWLSAHEIETMNPRSKQVLQRYLNKIDKEDPSAQEDGEFDPSYNEIEKILDCREEEVYETVDDIAPEVVEAGAHVPLPTTPPVAAENISSSSSLQTKSMSKSESLTRYDTSEDNEAGTLVRSQIWNAPERCRQVLLKLWDDPYATSFQYPVDTTEYEDYLDVVPEPICLEDVKKRLENGTYKGHTLPTRFAADIREIWKNCKIYNLHKSQIWYCAHTLSLMFERLFQAWVLSFQEGLIPFSDPIARPWENSCRICLQDENDEKVLLCDHCDASYHIYCLDPPLSQIPPSDEIWICSHCLIWLNKTQTKCLSATVEEEARQMTDNAKEKKINKIKKKKYLVKWRGLSFKDCTWETASDINDDHAISIYHQINDTPPEEPPLTQAEIGVELSKDRKSQKFPATEFPHALREADAAIYSQIRALHFLRFNLQPPDALLKECGPWSLSRVYGAKTSLRLPNVVSSLLEKALGEGGKGGGGDDETEVLKEIENEPMELQEDLLKESNETKVEVTPDPKVIESESSDSDSDDGEDWNTFRLHYRVPYVKGMTPEETLEAAEAAFEARKLARKKEKHRTVNSSSSSAAAAAAAGAGADISIPSEFVKQSWYVPPDFDPIRNEVSLALGDLMHTISRGTPTPPRSRPPLRSNEIEICVPKGNKGLSLNIGDLNDYVVVLGFRPLQNGNKGAIEASGKIKSGDILVAINGFYITDLEFRHVIKLLSSTAFPYIYLRFIRIPASAKDRLPSILRGAIKELRSSKPIPLRSRFVGVCPLNQGRFKAEVFHEDATVVVGIYDSEQEAADAYDRKVLQLHGRGKGGDEVADETHQGNVSSDSLKLNFVYDFLPDQTWSKRLNETGEPILTEASRLLHKVVKSEEKLTLERLKGLDQLFEKDLETRKKEKGSSNLRELIRKADSEDSEDSDSDLYSVSTETVSDSSIGEDDDDELNDDDDDDDDSVSSEDGEEEWDSDKQENDNEWKPKDLLEAGDGPFGRLLRAVNEAEYPPLRSEWNNYILELGVRQQSREVSSSRKIEQLDLASGVVTRVWDSVNAASRTLNIPAQAIQAVLDHKADNGGGFNWRYAADDDDDEDIVDTTPTKEEWQSKLYLTSKEYLNGGTLRDYQVDGLNWLLRCWYTKQSSILADEMGLGKTVQVVALLNHLHDVESIRGPFLVCVPLSTIEHWKRETETWTKMSACLYHDIGGGRDMRDVIREYEWYYKGRSRRLLKFHVLITTYDDLIRDYEELAEIPWRVVVVDEAHRLRNTNSKLLECMRAVVSKGQIAYGYQHRILMTGTPLQNNTAELWSLLNFIEPAKFPDAVKFAARYGNMTTQEQVESLQARIAPHLLRRVKEDVAKDIPPKQETIIDVELTTMQKQYYRAIFEHNHGFLLQSTKGSLPKLMNIQMELRKCCNHPYLITGVEQKEMEDLENVMLSELQEKAADLGVSPEKLFDNQEFESRRICQKLIPVSGKMVLLDKLLPKLQREDHKVLIFSQMVKMIDVIEEFCEARGYPVERLDGRVQGNDRQKAIDRFNTDPKSFIFLLSTRAGGVGINLTAADTVIIFDSDWNPQNDIQAMARCHRIGQSKNVTVYRLITRRSFEAEMFERASKKLGLEQALLGTRTFTDADHEENNSKIDAKEMETLLRQGAYALMMEDDSEIVKEFCEQDIETLLDSRAHVRVMEGTGNAADAGDADGDEGQTNETWLNKKKKLNRTNKSLFTGASSMGTAEIDVNDPDFWKKVLPDLVTPEMMIERLSDLQTQPIKRDGRGRKKKKLVESSSSEDDDDDLEDEEDEEMLVRKMEAVMKFMTDMEQMMEGILDLQRRGSLPDRERDTCLRLLLRLTLNGDILEPDQLSQAQEWLTLLEGTRRRGQTQKLEMVSQQNAILRKAANKRGKKGGPKKRKQLSDDSDVGSSDSEGAVKGDAAGKLGKKKATPKKKKAKAVSGDNENGSDGRLTDDENIATGAAGRGAGRGGRGGRGGAGRGRGGRGRGNKNSAANNSPSPEAAALPSLSAHAKSLRALRAVQATSTSRQLLEKSGIESEDGDDDLEWDEDILRPAAPPPGGGAAVASLIGGPSLEKIPPLARPPLSLPKISAENDRKTSRSDEAHDDFEENDMPDSKRMRTTSPALQSQNTASLMLGSSSLGEGSVGRALRPRQDPPASRNSLADEDDEEGLAGEDDEEDEEEEYDPYTTTML